MSPWLLFIIVWLAPGHISVEALPFRTELECRRVRAGIVEAGKGWVEAECEQGGVEA